MRRKILFGAIIISLVSAGSAGCRTKEHLRRCYAYYKAPKTESKTDSTNSVK